MNAAARRPAIPADLPDGRRTHSTGCGPARRPDRRAVHQRGRGLDDDLFTRVEARGDFGPGALGVRHLHQAQPSAVVLVHDEDRRELAAAHDGRRRHRERLPGAAFEARPPEHARAQVAVGGQVDLDEEGVGAVEVAGHLGDRSCPCRRRPGLPDGIDEHVNRLAAVDVADPGLVDSHLEAERPGAFDGHQRRAGRCHVARLDALLGDDAVERRRDHRIGRAHRGRAERRAGGLGGGLRLPDTGLRARNVRFGGLQPAHGLVEFVGGCRVLGPEVGDALVRGGRQREAGFSRVPVRGGRPDGLFGGGGASLGLGALRLQVPAVEANQHLAGAHLVARLDEDLLDLCEQLAHHRRCRAGETGGLHDHVDRVARSWGCGLVAAGARGEGQRGRQDERRGCVS
jgi:hypothetical protein